MISNINNLFSIIPIPAINRGAYLYTAICFVAAHRIVVISDCIKLVCIESIIIIWKVKFYLNYVQQLNNLNK